MVSHEWEFPAMRLVRRVFAGELWRKAVAVSARVLLCFEKPTGLTNLLFCVSDLIQELSAS
jgi:hypothetical protein